MTTNETPRKTRKQLREMADENGYIFKKGRKTPTLKCYPNGTILLCEKGMDLSTLKNISTKDAFKLIK